MKRSEMEASLFCTYCNEETPHMIVYINDEITSIECEDCHHIVEIKVDIMKEFYKELYERISTKPSRITHEYKRGLISFLSKLPMRAASKPYRLMSDLNQSRKVIRQFKKK
ncbi:bh protein [Metabacillus arenae]|uniref:Bh protein n=1 Tax=Metabacillus arenae TaxID=2771434 RepID=A0A926RYH1_9BACI|nr:bh protein [Metabacillus arenae]MBD1381740.1 bh protein [Metabacillus arenae]